MMPTTPMRIVVPYAQLHPVTQMVLTDYAGDAVTFARMDTKDCYRALLADLWSRQQDVIIVEQDIVPWPGALEELWGCMGQWCACSYKLFGGYGVYHGLGCTKLSGRLMAQLPNLWDEPCAWDVLDQRLFFAAKAIGQDPHGHRPSVLHLNPREYPTNEG